MFAGRPPTNSFRVSFLVGGILPGRWGNGVVLNSESFGSEHGVWSIVLCDEPAALSTWFSLICILGFKLDPCWGLLLSLVGPCCCNMGIVVENLKSRVAVLAKWVNIGSEREAFWTLKRQRVRKGSGSGYLWQYLAPFLIIPTGTNCISKQWISWEAQVLICVEFYKKKEIDKEFRKMSRMAEGTFSSRSLAVNFHDK